MLSSAGGRRAAGAATLLVVASCGGGVVADRSDDGRDTVVDASTHDVEPDHDAETDRDAGPREADVPDVHVALIDASCADIASEAVAAIDPIVRANLACATAEDCVPTFSATCAYSCGLIVNAAGASAIVSATAKYCPSFEAYGCKGTMFTCPSIDPAVCTGGQCASAEDFVLSDGTPGLAHAQCSAITLQYTNYWDVTSGAHAVSVAATNGTFYSDAACTTRVTSGSVTMPAGERSVVLGFVPTAAGSCTLTVGGVATERSAM